MAMWASGEELEAEAKEKLRQEADGVKRMKVSPEELKRRLQAKRAREKAAKEATDER